jgi:hypothetical protein
MSSGEINLDNKSTSRFGIYRVPPNRIISNGGSCSEFRRAFWESWYSAYLRFVHCKLILASSTEFERAFGARPPHESDGPHLARYTVSVGDLSRDPTSDGKVIGSRVIRDPGSIYGTYLAFEAAKAVVVLSGGKFTRPIKRLEATVAAYFIADISVTDPVLFEEYRRAVPAIDARQPRPAVPSSRRPIPSV